MAGTMTAMRARATSVWTLPRERQLMRAKLLEIARHLIAQHGEDALTLSAVANDADIAHATIYGYFSSKREMLNSLSSLPASPGGREPAQAAEPGPATGDQVPEPRGVVPAASMEEAGSGSLAVPVVGDDLEDTVPWNDDALDQPGEQDGHQPAVAATDHAAAISAAESYPEAAAPPQREPVVYAPVVEPQLSPNAEVGVASAALGETLTPATDGVEALAIADAPLEGESPEFGGSEGLHEPLAEDDFPDFEDVADGVAGLPDPGVPEGTTPEDQAGVFATILPGYEQRRAQADQLDTIARHLVLPEGAGKDGTDALIGRLETRLRVLESAIGSLGDQAQRAGSQERKTGAAGPRPDRANSETFGGFRGPPPQDTVRIAAGNPRTGRAAEQCRYSTQGRGIGRAAVVASCANSPQPSSPRPRRPNPLLNSESDEPHADSAADEPRHAYLSAVRTLAKEGARQAAERESIEEAEQHVRRRKVYVAAGVAVACLAAVGLDFQIPPRIPRREQCPIQSGAARCSLGRAYTGARGSDGGSVACAARPAHCARQQGRREGRTCDRSQISLRRRRAGRRRAGRALAGTRSATGQRRRAKSPGCALPERPGESPETSRRRSTGTRLPRHRATVTP